MHILKKLKNEVLSAKSEFPGIQFDSISGGIDPSIHLFKYLGNKQHTVRLGCWAGGKEAIYVKPLTAEEKEMTPEQKDDIAYTVHDDMRMLILQELEKIANKFDKEVENMMKKLGFTKK